MKKVPLSFLTWYLLSDFVPCAISAKLPVNSDRETKLNKRRPCVIEWSLQDSLELLAQQEDKNMGMLFSQSSDHLSRRGRRGCNLLTCSIHDLAYHINRLSNKMKAPLRQISPCGYGRRRRRYLHQHPAAPTHGESHLRYMYHLKN